MLACSVSRNLVHRHEPPVTGIPVKILLQDDEREIIVVDKPGSIVRVIRSSLSLIFTHCADFHLMLSSPCMQQVAFIPSTFGSKLYRSH